MSTTQTTCQMQLKTIGDLKKETLVDKTVKEHVSGGNSNGWDSIEKCVKEYDQKSDTKVTELKKENKKLKETLYSGTSVATGSIGAGTAGLIAGIPTGLWLIPKVISWIK